VFQSRLDEVPSTNESEVVDGAPPISDNLVVVACPKFEAASESSNVLALFIVPCCGNAAAGMPNGAVKMGVVIGPRASFELNTTTLP
jgi:hypothetical protein